MPTVGRHQLIYYFLALIVSWFWYIMSTQSVLADITYPSDNICPLRACQPMIYYMPFSVGGPTVSNICLLRACWPMIYYMPFSVGGLMVGNICMLTARAQHESIRRSPVLEPVGLVNMWGCHLDPNRFKRQITWPMEDYLQVTCVYLCMPKAP